MYEDDVLIFGKKGDSDKKRDMNSFLTYDIKSCPFKVIN